MKALPLEDALVPGYMLSWYRIERVLGRGGFGITYLAHDTNLDHPVAIKEYFLRNSMRRNTDHSVTPVHQGDHEEFSKGLDRFIKEARTLVKFNHPNIVRVRSAFETNSTAYMVMEYERGADLKQFILSARDLDESLLKSIILPISHGLSEVHRHGFIHRDIKPANIYIRENDTPVLLDFGSARQAAGITGRQMTIMVSRGYAPVEQHEQLVESTQGPWTDIYALGAVMYQAITGDIPVDSTLRALAVRGNRPDPLPPVSQIAAGKYSLDFLQSVDWALNVEVSDRPESLQQWRYGLAGKFPGKARLITPETVAAPASTSRITPAGDSSRGTSALALEADPVPMRPVYRVRKRKKRWPVRPGLTFAVLAICVAGYLYLPKLPLIQPDERQTGQLVGNPVTPHTTATTQAPHLVQSGESSSIEFQMAEIQNVEIQPSSVQPYEIIDSGEIRGSEIKPTEIELAEFPPVVQNVSTHITEPRRAAEVVEASPLPSLQVQPHNSGQSSLLDTGAQAIPPRKGQAISQDDLQIAIGKFNALALAIEQMNQREMVELGHSSGATNNFFSYVFDNFQSIEISLINITSYRSQQSIEADLVIDCMRRDNGDRAIPAAPFNRFQLRSQRTPEGWSKIYW